MVISNPIFQSLQFIRKDSAFPLLKNTLGLQKNDNLKNKKGAVVGGQHLLQILVNMKKWKCMPIPMCSVFKSEI